MRVQHCSHQEESHRPDHPHKDPILHRLDPPAFCLYCCSKCYALNWRKFLLLEAVLIRCWVQKQIVETGGQLGYDYITQIREGRFNA